MLCDIYFSLSALSLISLLVSYIVYAAKFFPVSVFSNYSPNVSFQTVKHNQWKHNQPDNIAWAKFSLEN